VHQNGRAPLEVAECYPGFSYLRGKPHDNPARLLFLALDQDNLDRRVVEALPWPAYAYPEMDWEWLTRNAKLSDRQNRLGFVVALAEEVAEKTSDDSRKRCFSQKNGSHRAFATRPRGHALQQLHDTC
jgi:hypothetical protein